MNSNEKPTRSLGAIFFRSLGLKCPKCGAGKLFTGFFKMNENCPDCGLPFNPAPGYYLGSIYFNYAFVTLVTAVSYPLLVFVLGYSHIPVMIGLFSFCLLFPLIFFRHARSLWRGFDEFFDPWDPNKK